ncbi:hypothetical protein BH23GEM6_BH23GEM6_11800 [soil metagenome]
MHAVGTRHHELEFPLSPHRLFMAEASDPPKLSDPPPAPHLPRRVHLYRYQWFGLPLLALFPILALFGFFGDTTQRVEARSEKWYWWMSFYPDRQRIGQKRDTEVRIKNASSDHVDTVRVSFDPHYVDRFSTVSFVPTIGAAARTARLLLLQ